MLIRAMGKCSICKKEFKICPSCKLKGCPRCKGTLLNPWEKAELDGIQKMF
ncbi:MAG: hypothetical protein ACD_79C01283G0005 [uncultured bacterium]|nr:MAG: hypothetical protein ACD_79C01283G0005 [uncultured bacterium]